MIQRCINYRISYGNYWKEFDSHFSVERRCKDWHLIANMALFSIRSLALKWNYFFISGIIVFVEYFNLYMKQLGFSSFHIGFTTLFGALQPLEPLFGFLGDRFRARKLIFKVLTPLLFLIILAPLLPLVVSLPTCFVNQSETSINQASHLSKEYLQSAVNTRRNMSFHRSTNPFLHPSNENSDSRFAPTFAIDKILTPVEEAKRNTHVPWLSTLFLFLLLTRAFSTFIVRIIISLQHLATITYLKEKRAWSGSYFMWEHIGGSVSLFAVGLLAAHFTLNICGVIGNGYYIAFVWASTSIMLSSFALPWFKYEYLEHRVMNWNEVKCVFCDTHYVFILIIGLFLGSCTSFQFTWEFWYIRELSGSPIIMGVAGLIRRPLVAVWFYLSGYLIQKVGDLKTIAVSLFLFFVSFLAISFINIPWLVLVVDILQAAGYGFSNTALNIHFSKPGSKASSAVILGRKLEFVILIGNLRQVVLFCVLNLVGIFDH